MNSARWSELGLELRAQWAANLRLRAFVWLALAIAWIYGLFLAGDAVDSLRKRTATLATEVDRLRPLAGTNPWTSRADDARQQLEALSAMQWREVDAGLAEAAFQDWVRSVADKSRLRVREVTLSRSAPLLPASTAKVVREYPDHPVRLRMTVELGRNELLAFLAEVARSERIVVVDRLLLKPGAPFGTAELDLRMLATLQRNADLPGPGGAR